MRQIWALEAAAAVAAALVQKGMCNEHVQHKHLDSRCGGEAVEARQVLGCEGPAGHCSELPVGRMALRHDTSASNVPAAWKFGKAASNSIALLLLLLVMLLCVAGGDSSTWRALPGEAGAGFRAGEQGLGVTLFKSCTAAASQEAGRQAEEVAAEAGSSHLCTHTD